MKEFFSEIVKNMPINQVLVYLDSIKGIEGRMIEIEKMDKSGLSLDEQEKLLNEYNDLWDKVSKMRKV